MVIGSKHWPVLRNAGRSRLLRVLLGVFVLTAALIVPIQSAGAAQGMERCGPNFTMDGPGSIESSIGYPGDVMCFEVWLESGYTYTFDIDPSTTPTNPEFNATALPLTDSVLTVYRYSLPHGIRSPWGGQWELAGYNDDVAYPADLSSRVAYEAVTPPEFAGHDLFKYRVLIGGYGSHTGAFKLTISRSVVMDPDQCWMIWGC